MNIVRSPDLLINTNVYIFDDYFNITEYNSNITAYYFTLWETIKD